jgi:UTP-glucose-1-phosphate uridylyltransferase
MDTSKKTPTLLVMAAGMGNRYGGLKQMDPMGPSGETLLDYSVFDALRAGFRKVVFIIRREMEADFRALVESRFARYIQVEFAFQALENLPSGYTVPEGRTKPWGTTHAVLSAAKVIHEPFAVINADDFYGAESYQALAEHWQSGTNEAVLVGFVLRRTLSDHGSVSRGVCSVSKNGYLAEIIERIKIVREGDHALIQEADGSTIPLTGDELVSMNMMGYSPEIFPKLEESFDRFLSRRVTDEKAECLLPTTVNELVTSGRMKMRVVPSHGEWFGVTYREDRERVQASLNRLIQSGAYPQNLWAAGNLQK